MGKDLCYSIQTNGRTQSDIYDTISMCKKDKCTDKILGGDTKIFNLSE